MLCPTPSYSPISASDSSSSLNLNQCLIETESGVLSESLTLDSLSSVSSGTTPPFPAGCMVPMSTILSVGSHLPLFPMGIPVVGGFSKVDKPSRAMLTTPTPPRQRTMLKECLCVRKWVESLVVSDPPGHEPWGDIEESPPMTWIPEGSIYPPEAFEEAMSNARRNRQAKSHGVPAVSSPAASPSFSSSTSFRNALVFEREITLNSGGKTRRWSFQVPASSMNPEMVDMMLELQNLNSFFKDGLDDADRSIASLGNEKGTPDVPSLIVSNSHFALPISLESSSNLSPDVPVALATRRGRKMLPPLSLQQDSRENPYPSIPTAFLGSPSSYSPKFEFANRPGEPSMDSDSMISSLRSQCASLFPFSPATVCQNKPEESLNPSNCRRDLLVQDSDEEWSFANGLMDKYGGSTFESTRMRPGSFDHHSIIQNTCSFDDADFEEEFLASNPTSTTESSLESIDAKIVDDARLHSRQLTSRNCTLPMTSRPPSTPLPPCPSPISSPVPRREVRGILKSRKSVRFASLPSRHETPSVNNKSHARAPRHSTGLPSATFSHRPSPLRNTITPRSATVRSASPLVPLSRPPPHPVTPTNNSALGAAGKQRRNTFAVSTRPVSTPTLASTRSSVKAATKQPLIKTPLRRSTVRHSEQPTQRSARQPSSLDRCPQTHPSTGKENKSLVPLTLITSPHGSIANENTFRRGSSDSTKDSGSKKGRLSVPFRNMLMRFK